MLEEQQKLFVQFFGTLAGAVAMHGNHPEAMQGVNILEFLVVDVCGNVGNSELKDGEISLGIGVNGV